MSRRLNLPPVAWLPDPDSLLDETISYPAPRPKGFGSRSDGVVRGAVRHGPTTSIAYSTATTRMRGKWERSFTTSSPGNRGGKLWC